MFKDHFSDAADAYSRHRPTYPPELFAALAELSPGRSLAWDAATGSGQAAEGLSAWFDRVVASDASPQQVLVTPWSAGVDPLLALSEAPPLASRTVDLVTVAQALHWFDLDAFYREVVRVARPGAVLSAWTYSLFRIQPELDGEVDRFFSEAVGAYWPAERRFVDERYRTLPFPFERLPFPELEIRRDWSLPELLDYVGTWSAVRRFEEDQNRDPVPSLAAQLGPRWGDPAGIRTVIWPIHALVGVIDS